MNIYDYISDNKMLTNDQREFMLAYAECLLWTSVIPDSDDMDVMNNADEYYGQCSLAFCSRVVMDCLEHLREASHLIIQSGIDPYNGIYENTHYSFEQAGHDFALTRNGHGAGYWDRGLGDLGEQLTTLAKDMGGIDLYIGDDELLYAD